MALRNAGFSSVLGVFLLACGSSSAAPAAKAGSASPEDACIAAANGKHDHKPNEPDTVTVRHILVKHTGSRSPPQNLTRTEGQACLRAQEALDKLKAGADFTKLVAEYSDSPGPGNDGALGAIHRAEMDHAFADAAFELEPGQMSNVVETPFGFHVIVRTE